MSDLLVRLQAALADRYAIERELGHGGMAVVFLAQDLKHHRAVAIKVLRPELAAAIGAERFLREIETAASLTHPHILPLHDSGEAGELLFYVMPYVEGESLRERLNREKQLPLEDALQITREVTDGLSYAHSLGLVHRDIKPENILLETRHAVVSDFGIARAITAAGGERLTETGIAVGTPAYMSPEQAAGEQQLDGRSDLYSLGCVLYEMLAGQPPFTGPTSESLVHQHLTAEPPSVTAIRPAVPGEVARTLRRALAKTPADRYSTAAEFARALGAPATDASWARSPRSAVRRTGLVVLALLGVVAGVWALWWRQSHPVTPVSPGRLAVLPFSVTASGQYAYLGEGMVNLLSTALEGAGEWRVVDPHALLRFVAGEGRRALDPERGRVVAEHFNAGLYILGSVVGVGSKLQLTASLYDPHHGEEAVAGAAVQGEETQLFALVDSLARTLLAHQGTRWAGRLTEVAARTTRSIPALKWYLRGEVAFSVADFDTAAAAFQRASAEDSLFTLAYYRLAIAADWAGQSVLAHHAAEQAARQSDRLSEPDRRLLEAWLAAERGAADEAERRYREILATEPENLEAAYQLGEVLYRYNPIRGRPIAEARPWFQRAGFHSTKACALCRLAVLAAFEGKYAEMDSLVRLAHPGPEPFLPGVVVLAFVPGDRVKEDSALALLRLAGDEALLSNARTVAVLAPDVLAAERVARLLTEPPRPPEVRARGHVLLAHLEMARGRWRAAQAEVAAADSLDRALALEYRAFLSLAPFLSVPRHDLAALQSALTRWDAAAIPASVIPGDPFRVHNGLHPQLRLYLLGLLSARLGDRAAALRSAAELERMGNPPEAGTLARDLAQSVRAQAAWSRPAEALAALEQAPREMSWHLMSWSPFFSQPYERFLRAELLRTVGRGAEALGWLGSFASAESPYDIVYRAPSYLRRGDIYTDLGQREQAITHYARFIELWKDCDPQLRPLVEEARTRLARLTKEPVRSR